MTPNMRATMQWLKTHGFMCSGCDRCRKGSKMTCQCPYDNCGETPCVSSLENRFTVDERTAISRAFDAGNYANAYETNDLGSVDGFDDMSEHERAAFVLGFFSSYSLDEIGSDREIFDECYFSAAGQYVIKVARYCDDRSEEFADEGVGCNA